MPPTCIDRRTEMAGSSPIRNFGVHTRGMVSIDLTPDSIYLTVGEYGPYNVEFEGSAMIAARAILDYLALVEKGDPSASTVAEPEDGGIHINLGGGLVLKTSVANHQEMVRLLTPS